MRRAKKLLALGLCLGLFVVSGLAADNGQNRFETRLVGSMPNIVMAGVPSGGAPWKVAASEVKLDNGQLRAEVQGLLLSAGPAMNTVGPVTMVLASLVCGGMVAASTKAVPLDAAGNAQIEDMIQAPAVCMAPAVLVRIAATVAGPNAVMPWIAVTGLMSGQPAE